VPARPGIDLAAQESIHAKNPVWKTSMPRVAGGGLDVSN